MSLIGTIVTEEEATPPTPSGSAPLLGQVVTEAEEDEYEQDLVLPEDFSVSALADSNDYMTKVRAYMGNRLGENGQQKEDEENREYVERFLSHMRSFENNTIDLTQEMSYIYGADEKERKQFAEAYDIYNSLPGMFSKGGGSVLSGLYDYTTLNVFDPANVVGLGVGTFAAKQFAKQGVKGVLKGLAKRGNRYFNASTVAGAAADGVLSAGMDAGLQSTMIEAGIQDEYSLGQTAAAFGLGAAGSQVAQSGLAAVGTGLRRMGSKAATGKASSDGRSLADEVKVAKGELTEAEKVAGQKREKAAKFEYDEARKLLDDLVETKYFDEQIDPLPKNRPEGGPATADEVFSPELKVRATKVITDVIERVAAETGRTLPGKEAQLSDRVLQAFQKASDDPDSTTGIAYFDDVDVDVSLERAINEVGLTPLEFAQVFRVTVSDAGKQLNQLSQLAKRLGEIGGLDKGAQSRINAWFETNEVPPSTLGSAYRAVDRETRAFIVSGLATTVRNASTTAIRGVMDTGARLIDGYVLAGFRNSLKDATSKPLNYTAGDANRDAMGFFYSLADRGYTNEVVQATLGDNPRLMQQIQRNVTDIGDGQLSKAARMVNFLNMAHDTVVRKSIYTASIERQLQRLTGKSVAETLAVNGRIPSKIVQQGVREALEFTYSDMPTDRFWNPFVKFNEALGPAPGILAGIPLGTTTFTFPRFLAAAAKFTHRYNFSGLGGAGYRIAKAARMESGAEKSAAFMKASEDLGKGMVGTTMLAAATAFRASNQDVKYYQYTQEDGKTGDLRPFFPLAPYLLIGDVLVKAAGDIGRKVDIDLGDGTIQKLSPRDVVEGLFGTRIAGGTALQIDFIQSFFDTKSMAQASEFWGNNLGEFFNRMNTNIFSSMVRDIERQYDADKAIIRNARQREEAGGFPLFWESFYKSSVRGMPEAFRQTINAALPGDPIPSVLDDPPLALGTRDEPLRYQAPLQQQFTGMRLQQAPNFLEKELTRLGIDNPFVYARGESDKKLTQFMREEMGRMADQIILPDNYDELSAAEQKLTLLAEFRRNRRISLQQAKNQMINEDQERFFKMEYYRLPSTVRALANERYKKRNDGASIEDDGAWVEGADIGYGIQMEFDR